jgi:formate--tetrahydrofolate ligase
MSSSPNKASTPKTVPPDIEIARQARMKPIAEIGRKLGIPAEDLELFGHYKAKISMARLKAARANPPGKLILVTAITPTPAGEGKTTTTIGLTDALNQIGKKALVCIREPSLGPCFGIKGGAAGGGYAQVVPMEDINLHFTGDFHAIGVAHNLLSACLDNHLHHGNALRIDPTRVLWRRVVDMNDRALREITLGLGGPSNGPVREGGYDITVASEVMAIFCLADSLTELKERLGKIVIAQTYDKKNVTAADLKVHGAMAALLKDAIKPNLVQTLEGSPALVHGGPFANIAHGCNSVIATRLALRLADYTITEAGFGADLGAEKFIDIKCRQSGIRPDAVVLVATVRALKMHGGVAKDALKQPDPEAVTRGLPNLMKHAENVAAWGLPCVVAINRFLADSDEEIAGVRSACEAAGIPVEEATHFADGGRGAIALAEAVVRTVEKGGADFHPTYPDDLPLWDKVRAVAQKIYGADDIMADAKVRQKFRQLEADGYGRLPVCVAKTQYSFSTDPLLRGRPRRFDVPLRDVRLSAGAGFVVVLAGDIMTMPGLPKQPAAEIIDIDEDGNILGLS